MTETQFIYLIGMSAGAVTGIVLAFVLRPRVIKARTAARRVNALKVADLAADPSQNLTVASALDLLTKYRSVGALSEQEFDSQKARLVGDLA
ncbi:hypothetical protein [Arthrobacter sp. UYCo732]|uniref:hypothetical protein n=1 Tax=Arthrobacter sp. UYCo732 TaxID=3156336 RepID=UPI003396C808